MAKRSSVRSENHPPPAPPVKGGEDKGDIRREPEINRISLNGCRYVVTRNRPALEEFCRVREIPERWIRHQRGKFYLRLWGEWKKKAA